MCGLPSRGSFVPDSTASILISVFISLPLSGAIRKRRCTAGRSSRTFDTNEGRYARITKVSRSREISRKIRFLRASVYTVKVIDDKKRRLLRGAKLMGNCLCSDNLSFCARVSPSHQRSDRALPRAEGIIAVGNTAARKPDPSFEPVRSIALG